MQNSLYSVTNDDLRRLNAGEAVALIASLLWAEATRLGIPISKIHISSNVNTPDGGVDAKISDQTVAGDLIRAGHAAYQIKSGKEFEPHQEHVIKNELFGEKNQPSKENLKQRIRECMEEKGTYVLVCTGVDPVDRSVAEGHLRKFFLACGYTNAKVEVWVQNQLCGFLTNYPSVALRVNGRESGELRTHRSWGGDAEMGLAEAENETWTNNATGVFAELFSPGHGEVAPTEASPQERFPVLERALTSESSMTRAIALKACDAALEARHFSRTIGAEHQGFKLKPKLWTPKTYGEIWDAYQKVWNLLRKQLPSLPADQRVEAVKILFNNGSAIAASTNLGELVLETWKEIRNSGWATTAEVLQHLISFLRYRRNELRPEIIELAEKFRDELVGNGFPALMKRYVAMDLLEDHFDDKERPTDARDKRIQALAEQCSKQPSLLQAELSWLITEEAKNGYRFGYELSKLDKSRTFLKEIVEAQRKHTPKSTPFFLSGYMRAIFESETSKWEQLLDAFTADDQMRAHVPELTWRSGMSDSAGLRILKLAQAGQMEISQFGMFCMGGVIKDLSEDVFRQWAEFLLQQTDVVSVRILINLMHFYFLDAKPGRKLPADLARRALGHTALFQTGGEFHTMDRYHWAAVGSAFASIYPKESLSLAKTIVEHFGEEGTIVGRFDSEAHKVLMEITEQNPREVWELVSERLGPPIDSRAFHLKSWLRGEKYSPGGEAGVLPLIPLDAICRWVDADPEKRAWYLASFVPKQLFRQAERPCLAREVLIRYGADSSVRNNLMANFSTEGWSGPASAHYQAKKQWLLAFKEEETDANVKLWIDEYVEDLQRQIDHAKVREEREAF